MPANSIGGLLKKRGPERFALRVVKGGFQPADITTQSRLRGRKYQCGDLIFAEFKKPRNPRFHRLAHSLGLLFVDNIEAFDGLDSHTVLKRLQLESGVGCDEIMVPIATVWPRVVSWVADNIGKPFATVLGAAIDALGGKTTLIPVLIPRSISFESLDEGEFRAVIAGICTHVSKTYWQTLTAEQIEDMATIMVDPV